MELTGQHCSGCERLYAGGGACPACGRREGLEPATWSGKGVIYSFARIHVGTPEYQERVPYVLALVDLEGGPRVTGQVDATDPAGVRIDGAVVFDHSENGVLFFQPAP